MAKRSVGRPCDFTPALGEAICDRLIEGESLRSVCSDPAMPHRATVCRWLARGDAGEQPFTAFVTQYARATEFRADALFDESQEIADDSSRDWEVVRDGEGQVTGIKVDGEHVQRSKLRVETRKWMAGKLAPKRYGDKVEVHVGNPEGGPLTTVIRWEK